MNAIALAQLYTLGGALLGLWAFVRFPDHAPSSVGRAMLALFAATAALGVVPGILGYTIDNLGKPGALLGLVGVALPTLTALFWSIACVFQAFAGLLNRGAR